MSQLTDILTTLSNDIKALMLDVKTLLTVLPSGDEPIPSTPPATILRGNFIRKDAHESTHYLMSDLLSDADRRVMIDRDLGEGYNIISIMPWYKEDYNKAYFPVDYRSTHTFPNGVPHPQGWIHWLLVECANKGLEPLIWLMTDDSMPFFNRADLEEVKGRWKDFLDNVFTILPITNYRVIIGLEALEYWTESQVIELGLWLKQHYPKLDVGFHTLAGDRRLIDQDFYDTLYYQYSDAERTPETIGIATKEVIALSGKPVVASEYTLSGETLAGKLLGDIALQNGAVGAINGCSAIHTPTTSQYSSTPAQPLSSTKILTPPNSPVVNPFTANFTPTITLDSVTISNKAIRFSYHKPTEWDKVSQSDGSTSIGHLWCVQNVGDIYYTNTIDWLRNPSQQTKAFPEVMTLGQLPSPMSFKPNTTYGFFISTPARNGLRTTDEISNIIWINVNQHE